MSAKRYHTFMDYAGATLPGFIVPQEVYHTNAVFQPYSPFKFFDHDQFGIRLIDALASNFSGLYKAQDEVVLNPAAVRVALRIMWPGYGRWEKWVSVYTHSSNKRPITTAQLVNQIALKVKQFYEAKIDEPSTEESADWWISRIPFERLSLLELRHVAPGSWQPVLCVLT